MKRLLILRHAKSSWADSSQEDWQRPLNDRGRRDAPRAGEWLRERGLTPDIIVTSDAVRARATAQAVSQACGYGGEVIKEPSLYHATPEDAIEVVTRISDAAQSAMIVGHNPGLEELVSKLSGESHGMPTAALFVFDLPIARWRELDLSVDATIVESWQPRDAD
jgi:phosphohistidine phosphatase